MLADVFVARTGGIAGDALLIAERKDQQTAGVECGAKFFWYFFICPNGKLVRITEMLKKQVAGADPRLIDSVYLRLPKWKYTYIPPTLQVSVDRNLFC